MDSKLLSQIPLLSDVDVKNKVCLVRVDFNVPIKDGKISNPARVIAAKKTIQYLLDANAKVILLSHLSRVKSVDDIKSGKKSLKIVVDYLKTVFPKNNVTFVDNNRSPKLPEIVKQMKSSDIILLENTRYNDVDVKTGEVVKHESKNNPELAKFWASLADVYVNDAFATIHRGHASNAGIAKLMKDKCIGFLIQNELENIVKFDKYADRPIVAVIGGAKISDKIKLLETLAKVADQMIIGGAMANTFLAANGVNVGKSLIEKETMEFAKNLYLKYKDKIMLPSDVAVAKEFKDGIPQYFSIDKIPADAMALDMGPKTIKAYTKVIKAGRSIFWNGPTGVAEFKNFSKSCDEIANAIAEATSDGAYSLIGGGDTLTAATKKVKASAFSFASTGGGATLAVLANEDLPGLFFTKTKKI